MMNKRDKKHCGSVSLAGCCFLGIYEVGVCGAINEFAPHLFSSSLFGCSMGAIIATCVICGVNEEAMVGIFLDATRAHSMLMHRSFRKHMETTLPENAHELCSGRLHVSLTRLNDMKNVIVTDFYSKADLIQALVCSSFIPVYMGLDLPKFHGETYIDGGLSDNQPVLDEHTITVSPFSGTSDICPKDNDSASIHEFLMSGTSMRFTESNLHRFLTAVFPARIDECVTLCQRGYMDALRFLVDNDLTPCVRCLGLSFEPTPAAESLLRFYRSRSHASRNSLANMTRKTSRCNLCNENTEPFPISQSSVIFSQFIRKRFDEECNARLISGRLQYTVGFIFNAIDAYWEVIRGCVSFSKFAMNHLRSWLLEWVQGEVQ